MAIAWVFPGQGSQKVGMAEALLSIEGSRERFAMASELLGRDLLAICQGESGGGDGLDDLNDTRNTQPALFVIESVLAETFSSRAASLRWWPATAWASWLLCTAQGCLGWRPVCS